MLNKKWFVMTIVLQLHVHALDNNSSQFISLCAMVHSEKYYLFCNWEVKSMTWWILPF